MRTSTAPYRGWLTGAALPAVHVLSWPGACAVIVTVFGTLVYRLLAERARRKTLEAAFRAAPPDTVVIQDAWPGGPAMRIWIGGAGPPAHDQDGEHRRAAAVSAPAWKASRRARRGTTRAGVGPPDGRDPCVGPASDGGPAAGAS